MNPATIIAIGTAIKELINAALKSREALRQNQEWTVAQEEAFEKHIASQLKEPHWRTDEEL